MANTQIEFIRFAADQALSVPQQIQLRPYTIKLIKLVWSGAKIGLGTADGYETTLLNINNVNIRFRQVSKRDIALSGGVLKDQDVIIGPLVFPYLTSIGNGGTDPKVFSPDLPVNNEFYINITGPNFPTGGSNFKKIYDTSERSVMYRVFLRNTGSKMPPYTLVP